MFTGIIKELGTVRNISGLGNIYKLSVEIKDSASDAKIGDSIAINGACLTLTKKNKNMLDFDVMAETMRKTALGRLRPYDKVNIEYALKAHSPVGGHFVTGHIDCVGKITDIKRSSGEVSVEIVFPQEHKDLVVKKGSVALDGISLTVGDVVGNSMIVYIIPHTLNITTLGSKKRQDEVNIEFDMIGKYVVKLAKKE
jgi:riboflavin synthase